MARVSFLRLNNQVSSVMLGQSDRSPVGYQRIRERGQLESWRLELATLLEQEQANEPQIAVDLQRYLEQNGFATAQAPDSVLHPRQPVTNRTIESKPSIPSPPAKRPVRVEHFREPVAVEAQELTFGLTDDDFDCGFGRYDLESELDSVWFPGTG
jgi:hypothetical protein